MSFMTVTPLQTPITAAPFNDILAGINGLRAANGRPPLTWEAILPSNILPPAVGRVVYAAYVTSLRSRLNEALLEAGLPVLPYTDPSLNGLTIKALYVQQLQQRMQ